jgi:hypothetical protein
MLHQCTSSLSFTQRLFGEMMMYVASMYIQLKLYPEALGEMMMYVASMYIQLKLYPQALWRNDDVCWINVHPA